MLSILIVVLMIPGYFFAQLQRPGITVTRRSGSFILRTKPDKEQKKRLQPDSQELRKYERFLQNPRTGIFRLMPDIGCTENMYIIKADADCLKYIPESSYYSFREKEHTIEMLSDIRLRNGYLITDGILSQGILVNLGEIELENVGAQAEGLEYMMKFTPESEGLKAQKQFVQMMRGVKTGKYEYKKAQPLIENSTYALRVIAYRGSFYRSFRGYRFDLLSGDKRIDLTIAFRVLRKDQDGGITLLWKEIERRESPRLIFPKRRQKT